MIQSYTMTTLYSSLCSKGFRISSSALSPTGKNTTWKTRDYNWISLMLDESCRRSINFYPSLTRFAIMRILDSHPSSQQCDFYSPWYDPEMTLVSSYNYATLKHSGLYSYVPSFINILLLMVSYEGIFEILHNICFFNKLGFELYVFAGN